MRGTEPPKYSEGALQALETYCLDRKEKRKPRISSQLQRILQDIAACGETCYSWSLLRKLVSAKVKEVLHEKTKDDPVKELRDGLSYEKRLEKLLKTLESFDAPPFTLQRICELLFDDSMYAKTYKYLFAMEKLVFVTSTIPPLSPRSYDTRCKELSEPLPPPSETLGGAPDTTPMDTDSDSAVPMETS